MDNLLETLIPLVFDSQLHRIFDGQSSLSLLIDTLIEKQFLRSRWE
jgi:hypothetical protein